MVRAYAQTFLLKRRIDNETMWLMGSYVANAFSVVLHNAFNSTKKDYLKQPMDIFPKTEAEKNAEIREERRKLITWLNGMTRKFNRKKKDTGSESDGKS